MIRDIRDLARNKLPQSVTGGQDILIDLAAAHQLGRSLTMKQMVLMRGGSATTIRRQVNALIDAKYVVKVRSVTDGRSDYFTVSKSFLSKCAEMGRELKQISVEFERRSGNDRSQSTPERRAR
jgi:DNA-binding MarR family transcriptional regulator